jgi:hypothetical protein
MLTVAVAPKELYLDFLFYVITAEVCRANLNLIPLNNLFVACSSHL